MAQPVLADSKTQVTAQDFFKQLRQQYKNINQIKTVSLTYRSPGIFGPQSYDYLHPDKSYRRELIDFDLTNNSYFSHLIRGGFPGGFIFDTKEYQHEMKRFRYDVNGVLYGKQILKLDTEFGFKQKMASVGVFVDLLAIKPLLSPMLNQELIKFSANLTMNTAIVEYSPAMADKLIYTFTLKPLTLKLIEQPSKKISVNFSDRVYYQGVEYASQATVVEDDYTDYYFIEHLSFNQKISAEKFAAPMGYGPVVNFSAQPKKVEMIANNLYLVSHVAIDRHVVFKVNKMGIMVFGAPSSDKESEEVIALIKQQFPMKKISHVYITHPHSDHIDGLQAYAKIGAIVLADAYSIEAIKAYSLFSNSISQFKFQVFADKEMINGVRFYLPPNSHAKGQSFAYFEQEQIIYEGDLLEIPFDNSIATYLSAVEREFIEYLNNEKLKIKRIVGHHRNGNISPEVMQAYYDFNTKQ